MNYRQKKAFMLHPLDYELHKGAGISDPAKVRACAPSFLWTQGRPSL
jgi:hypothetical protein